MEIREIRLEAIKFFKAVISHLAIDKQHRYYLSQRDSIRLRHILKICVDLDRNFCEQSLYYDWYDTICLMFENNHIDEYILNHIDRDKLIPILKCAENYINQPQLSL